MKKWVLLLVLVIAMVSIAMVMTLTGCQDGGTDVTNPTDKSEETDVVGKPADGDSTVDSGVSDKDDETDKSESGENGSNVEGNDQPQVLTFAEFLLMTPAEQQAYMDSYADIMDFLEWYRVAEEQYKEEQEDIEIGGSGDINIGDFIN